MLLITIVLKNSNKLIWMTQASSTAFYATEASDDDGNDDHQISNWKQQHHICLVFDSMAIPLALSASNTTVMLFSLFNKHDDCSHSSRCYTPPTNDWFLIIAYAAVSPSACAPIHVWVDKSTYGECSVRGHFGDFRLVWWFRSGSQPNSSEQQQKSKFPLVQVRCSSFKGH